MGIFFWLKDQNLKFEPCLQWPWEDNDNVSNQKDEGLSRAKFNQQSCAPLEGTLNIKQVKSTGRLPRQRKLQNNKSILISVRLFYVYKQEKKIAKCIWRREDTAKVLQGASNATTMNKLIMTTILSILRTKVATKCLTQEKGLNGKVFKKHTKSD